METKKTVTVTVSDFEFNPKQDWEVELKGLIAANLDISPDDVEILQENHTGSGVSVTGDEYGDIDLIHHLVSNFDFFN